VHRACPHFSFFQGQCTLHDLTPWFREWFGTWFAPG
jgi:hypothetical protein